MKLYLCMVLGGSACTLLYIIFDYLLPYELSLQWKNIFLKINFIFYLLPVPLLLSQLKITLWPILEKARKKNEQSYMFIHPNSVWESLIVSCEKQKKVCITGYQKCFPFVVIVSVLFVALLAGWIISYMILNFKYKQVIIYTDLDDVPQNEKSRKIQVGISSRVSSPIAIGIIKPVILLPSYDKIYADSIKGIIGHEVKHIQNKDGIFRFLSFVIIAMEWFNPFAYYLLREHIAVSEMMCDEAAVEGMSKEEKIQYMRCIIAAAEKPQGVETVVMTLGAKRGLSKERMIRIMNKNDKKVWKNRLAMCIVAVSFMLSSIPALAYEEPINYTYTTYVEPRYITSKDFENTDWIAFISEGEINPYAAIITDFSRGDYVFISETGEIYLFEESLLLCQEQMKLLCLHNYETGTYSEHKKNSDSSCEVINYSAQICTKCGYKKSISEISTTSYKICPH
ncbi:MAG: M56 family metallopeptidase [Lachnospiraceae bacterium]|nr:M56 family metallopeptidase [Lachnospiraceae bacterium]